MAVALHLISPHQLDKLRLQAFRCTPGVGDAARVQAAVRSLPSDPPDDAVIVGAVDGSLTVGLAVAVRLSRPGLWHIPMLAVRVPWQGKRLGRQLKERCLDEIEAQGGDRVVSSVHTETAPMNRINQTITGAEWGAEPDGPGVFYSIDLALRARSRVDPDAQLRFPPPNP